MAQALTTIGADGLRAQIEANLNVLRLAPNEGTEIILSEWVNNHGFIAWVVTRSEEPKALIKGPIAVSYEGALHGLLAATAAMVTLKLTSAFATFDDSLQTPIADGYAREDLLREDSVLASMP